MKKIIFFAFFAAAVFGLAADKETYLAGCGCGKNKPKFTEENTGLFV